MKQTHSCGTIACKLDYSSSEPLGQFHPNLTQCISNYRGFKVLPKKNHVLKQENISMLTTCNSFTRKTSNFKYSKLGTKLP